MAKPPPLPTKLEQISDPAAAQRQIEALLAAFEDVRHENKAGTELWYCRDLMRLFEYAKWSNFRKVIERAWMACREAHTDPSGHFVQADGSAPWTPESFFTDPGKKSGRGRPSEDVIVSRYAAYLIAENADPSKPPVAFAQRYFAEQTRRQELADSAVEALTEDQRRVLMRGEVSEQQKGLAAAAASSGVKTPKEFAIFQTEGYRGMYGGLNVDGIKKTKGIPSRDAILDRMGSTELAANLFRLTQTEERLRQGDIHTKAEANRTHHAVGVKVRQAMKEISGTVPEKLAAADHIKHARKRVEALGASPALPAPAPPIQEEEGE